MDKILHYNMSFVGGFLGAYAVLLRGGNFGSAQTGNLILLFGGWLKSSMIEMIIRIVALVIFVCAMIAAYLLAKNAKGDTRRICILIEIAGIFLTGFLPGDMNDVVALYPVFAITAFQWGIFSGTGQYNSATIFSTNNLKQMVLSWTEYVGTKNLKVKDRAVFYTATLAAFHLGVVGGLFAVMLWDIKGIWACLLPLGIALVMVERDCRRGLQKSTGTEL